jgi:hypothetical protein
LTESRYRIRNASFGVEKAMQADATASAGTTKAQPWLIDPAAIAQPLPL